MTTLRARIMDIVWPALAIIALFFVVSQGCFYTTKRIPTSRRLAEVSGTNIVFELKLPRADRPQFVLGYDRDDIGPTNLSGRIVVSRDGVVVTDLVISTTQCNWIRGQPGMVLTWEDPNWADVLSNGETYVVNVVFRCDPPENSSLWLCTVETGLERLINGQ